MWLIVGLGNPGPKYRDNRHNVGWKVVDRLVARANADAFREKFRGEWTRGKLGGDEVVFLKPLTFMNLSGESVQAAMTFFKIPLDHVIVIHDELDLAWKDVRVKIGGGAAGHNGLRSMIQHCGGPDFVRVRVGIGRPPRGATESWVLGDFDRMESAELPDVLEAAALATGMVVEHGAAAAQNKTNRAATRPAPKPPKPAPTTTSSQRPTDGAANTRRDSNGSTASVLAPGEGDSSPTRPGTNPRGTNE